MVLSGCGGGAGLLLGAADMLGFSGFRVFEVLGFDGLDLFDDAARALVRIFVEDDDDDLAAPDDVWVRLTTTDGVLDDVPVVIHSITRQRILGEFEHEGETYDVAIDLADDGSVLQMMVDPGGDPTSGEGEVVGEGDISVQIDPDTLTLDPGAEHPFAATVLGTTASYVRFSADGGSIDDTGRYTAPTEPGEYHVTATSLADPRATDTATVIVRDPA